MTHCTWTTGRCPAAVTPRGVIVLEPGREDLVAGFWEELNAGADLGALLQSLTSAFAADLAALPAFVALINEGGTAHIAVRGVFGLVVRSSEGAHSLSSGNVITWSEHRLPRVEGWSVTCPAEDLVDTTSESAWRIINGVVPVQSLSWGADGSGAPVAIGHDEVSARGSADSLAPTGELTADEVHPTGGDAVLGGGGNPQAQQGSPTRMDSGTTADPLPGGSGRAPGTPTEAGVTWSESAVAFTLPPPGETSVAHGGVLPGDVPPDGQPLSGGRPVGSSSESVHQDAGEGLPDRGPASPRDVGGAMSGSGDFSDLFSDHTIHHAVEEAAVRHVRDDDADEAARPRSDAPSGTGPSEAAGPSVGAGALPDPSPAAGDVPVAPSPSPTGGTVGGSGPASAGSGGAVSGADGTGFFVDAVPTPGAVPPAPDAGDHDGHTVRSTRLDELRARAREIAGSVASTVDGSPEGPEVLAILCVEGHPNPTHASVCRTCGEGMSDRSVTIPRPNLGSLVISTGETVPLDRDVIIGRRPRYVSQSGRPEAHLVPVPSPNQQISRTHCEVRVDGWDVRVRDLGSNNGTFLMRTGQEPVRISESAPLIVRPGDVIDLGDSVTMRVEA
ncbi:FHA domain-containing protein [Actinomyces provencensis]|uniref:FHA domain-containing protein n=1 Tax=Actinomyces provencensis TaxID=1720198 RepID=UPI00098F9515|nr:FHA domain-containing protein [Actinomyces provencensis]